MFTDAAFSGPFTLSSYTCTGNSFNCNFVVGGSGLSSNTFSGSTLTLTFSNITGGQQYVFTQAAAPVSVTPEPSSIALLGTGLLAATGAVRRRYVR